MRNVIEFPFPPPERSCSGPEAKPRGQVIIFPGVRYEHVGTEPPPAGRHRRKRDRLELSE